MTKEINDKNSFIERYISIHCGNYSEKEKTIVRNSMDCMRVYLQPPLQEKQAEPTDEEILKLIDRRSKAHSEADREYANDQGNHYRDNERFSWAVTTINKGFFKDLRTLFSSSVRSEGRELSVNKKAKLADFLFEIDKLDAYKTTLHEALEKYGHYFAQGTEKEAVEEEAEFPCLECGFHTEHHKDCERKRQITESK